VPNFTRLDPSRLEIAILVDAMLRAHEVVANRSWSTSQEPTTEHWWADVLGDPRARIRRQLGGLYVRDSKRTARKSHYRLACGKGRDRPDCTATPRRGRWVSIFAAMGATALLPATRANASMDYVGAGLASRAAIFVNCSNAVSRSSAISAARISGAGSASVSVRLLSLIQNRSRLSLSRFNSSSQS
jgi:hypothetical protein